VSVNERERGYCDLRQVVIDVMLDAGERGVADFGKVLEKTARELRKRGGVADGPEPFPHGLAARMRPDDSDRVREIVWELARQGILTFGRTASDAGWPGLARSRFSPQALRHATVRSPDHDGFMKALRLEAANVSPDAVVYLREAIAAFYMDCLLSACVMLGLAAEGEFLRLLSVARNSATHGRHFSRIADGLAIDVKISLFREAIHPLRDALPRPATVELDHNLDTVQSVIRAARKASGEPSGARLPSRDRVHLYLQLFLPFAKQAMRLRQELKEVSYPRLVRLH
jgi:hypothetical protein